MFIATHQNVQWHTHRCQDRKGQKVGSGPMPENPHPFSKIAGILLPLIVVVQSLGPVQPHVHATPRTTASQAPLSSTISWSMLKFMSVELVMLSNHLILCHPVLLLPSLFPSIRVFSNESALRTWWPKYWSFSSFSLSCEITHPHKYWQPHTQRSLATLAFQDGPHSVYGVCFLPE